jgi:CzcA family heavy metal efflux pump
LSPLALIVRWALARPRLVIGAALWFLVFGALFLRGAPIDLLPNLAPASATITTDAPGLVAEQVEQSVTLPIENTLIGAAGVAHVDSRSLQGLSIITVRFALGADPYRVRQLLAENLARVGGLPLGVSPPRLLPLSAPGASVLQIGFTSDKLDAMALRDLVQWTVRPRLLSAAGVARVTIHGGGVRRIEVRARPADLSDSDLGFLDILNATRRATSVAGAGFIDTPSQRVLIEPRGQAHTKEDVGAGQIQTAGSAPVRIDDVADVSETAAPALGDALIDGKPGVLLTVDRQFDANTVATTRSAEDALAVLRPVLAAQSVKVWGDLDRPASFIAEAVRGVMADLLIGAALVVIATILFMRDIRAALIALVGVPLTLVASAMAIKALGWTLNAMTIGGLVVALGVVIDDAVVDVENIVADLRQAETRHASRATAIFAASLEVRAPVVYGTLALILSLLPLLTLGGPEGALLAPLAFAIIVAALASLVIAVTVAPAMALLFLKHVKPSSEPGIIARAREVQAAWLRRAGARPWLLLLAILAIVGLAVGACFFFRSEFLPSVHDDHLVIEINAPASTSPSAMDEMGARIAADLGSVTHVATVAERIGRDPAGDDDGAELQHGVFDVAITPGLNRSGQERVAEAVDRRLSVYRGLGPVVRSGFDSAQATGGPTDSFAIGVFGPDLDADDAAAGRLAALLRTVSGAGEVQAPPIARAPTVRVDLNFPRLALFGLSAADVLDTLQAAFAGETVAQIYEGPRIVDLAVSAQTELRRDPEAVGDLLLRSTSGISVPLKSVANVYLSDGPAMIAHENGLRRQRVEANPRPGAIAAFTAAARAAIAHRLELPAQVFLDFESPDTVAHARGDLEVAYVLAILAVFGLLTIAFDGRTAMLALFSTLFSLVGAVVAVALSGGLFSLGAMVGLITLFGLSLRSAVLLIARAEDLALERETPWSLETLARAAGERTVPLVMTSLLVILAVAPLAMQADGAGREILGPMAMVIIGGQVTAALANLLLLPILVFVFWRPDPGRRRRHHVGTTSRVDLPPGPPPTPPPPLRGPPPPLRG